MSRAGAGAKSNPWLGLWLRDPMARVRAVAKSNPWLELWLWSRVIHG